MIERLVDESNRPDHPISLKEIDELKASIRTLPVTDNPRISQFIAALPGRIRTERRVDPGGVSGTIGGPPPSNDLGRSAVEVGLISSALNAPADGWPAQYRRCSLALSGGGPDNSPSLDDLVRKLNVNDSSRDPIASFRQASAVDRKAFVAAVRNYDDACLTDLSIPPPPPELAKVLGFITFSDLPFCAGLLVNDDTVLTARHCFVGADGRPLIDRQPERGLLRFHPIESGSAGFIITAVRENRQNTVAQGAGPKRLDTQTDYVFAKLEKPSVGTLRLPVGRPDVGDNLVIAGVNVFVYMANLVAIEPEITSASEEKRRSILTAAARTSVRWDRAPICHVFKKTDRCFYHVCQTLAGYSGSPAIRVNKALRRFEIAGIHTGALPLPINDSCSMDSDGIVNTGTYAFDDVATAVAAKNWNELLTKLTR